MTNHIEELMKAAGVQKREIIDCCSTREYFECQDKHNCANCDKCRSIECPAFTPAKQLELIKLLGKRRGYGCIGEQIDYFTETDGLSFSESIAQIASNALSSKILNKAEVKRILKDD